MALSIPLEVFHVVIFKLAKTAIAQTIEEPLRTLHFPISLIAALWPHHTRQALTGIMG